MGTKTNRKEMVKIYLTEEEKQKVEQDAEQQGLRVSSYGRTQLLQGEA